MKSPYLWSRMATRYKQKTGIVFVTRPPTCWKMDPILVFGFYEREVVTKIVAATNTITLV